MKHRSLLALLFLVASALPAIAAQDERPDLTGNIVDSSGAPAPGVTVMILAAGPRSGNSPLCPYTYPDCGKKAVSDGKGNFRIPSLDPAMDFCVIALAPGFEPFIQSKIIPEAGPIPVRLKSRDLSKVPAKWHISGRIIGPEGAPVTGAIIDVEGVERGDSTQWGGNNVTEGTVISDSNGEFHLVAHTDFTAVQCLVEASGLAPRWARLVPAKTVLLRMSAGAAVKGRMIWKGQPLRGVALAMSTTERECGKYFNGFQAVTGDDGRFLFEHVPAAMTYELYGTMNSFGPQGVAFQREIAAAEEASGSDIGDLQAEPAHSLSGRVILSDGKPVPPQTRLMIDRAAAWDTALVQLDEHGAFELTGVPAEQVSLIVSLRGYRFSEKNPNLSPSSHDALIGRVTGDISGLNILLEPGARPNWNDFDRPSYEDQQKAEQMPLRGVP